MENTEKMNGRAIVKNTGLLYFRMFLLMIIGLYSSRVVLQTLGVSDYGVYNVVGGFVSMLAYVKTGFVTACQRYLTYALGKKDHVQLKVVFSSSMSVFYIFAVITLVIAESFGIWYVNEKLVVDPGRLTAAHWVFQCSLVTILIEMISIPYNSAIIAHEHMSAYAYVSILDAVMRLALVLMLVYMPGDKLILYGLMMMVCSVVVRIVYVIYCKRHFEECHYKLGVDLPLLKRMFTFQGWSALGTLGFSFKDQIINLVLNAFGGTVLNAARGISQQVSGAVNQFAANFMLAVTPQITKQYAAGNLSELRTLVYASAKFSFFLMAIVTVPLLINLEGILHLWLGIVPDYAEELVAIIMVGMLIGTLSDSSTKAIMATGDIRNFQIGISLIFIAEIPLAYLLLKGGNSPVIAMMPSLFTQSAGVLYRFAVLRHQVAGFSFRHYLGNVVLRAVVVVVICLAVSLFVRTLFADGLLTILLTTILSVAMTVVLIFWLGVTRSERDLLRSYAMHIFHRNKNRNNE